MGDISITVLASQDAREARIRKLCQDHAWRFHQVCPGSEARYVIEGYVRDASPADWDCAFAYVAATPELFTSWPHRYPDQVRENDAANSGRLSAEAADAYQLGEYDLALALIDDADWWFPLGARLDMIRGLITGRMAGR